jgi:hypothetical protein
MYSWDLPRLRMWVRAWDWVWWGDWRPLAAYLVPDSMLSPPSAEGSVRDKLLWCSVLFPVRHRASRAMAALDATIYTDKEHTPELALRQIFVVTNVDLAQRKALADMMFVKVDNFAAVADSATGFRTQICLILSANAASADADGLGNSIAAKAANLAFLSGAWRKCATLATHRDSQRARLEEDPLKIPEIALGDYSMMKTKFLKDHVDVIMTDFREPHKRFIERLLRDFTINEVILPYELGEVRLKSEKITQSAGLARTPELLLKIAKIDEAATVTMEEDALNRIYAFWIALEYTGHCSFTWFKEERHPTSDKLMSVTGGPLNFLQELESRRRETHGLRFLVLIDKKVRGKVHQLVTERAEDFPNISMALHHVLKEDQHIWGEARAEAREGGQGGGGGVSSKRRRRDESSEGASVSSISVQKKQKKKSKKGKQEGKKMRDKADAKAEKIRKLNAAPHDARPEVPKGGGKAGRTNLPPIESRIPPKEFAAFSKVRTPPSEDRRCRFFNLSCGCQREGCTFNHVCWQCGSKHKWVDQHFAR